MFVYLRVVPGGYSRYFTAVVGCMKTGLHGASLDVTKPVCYCLLLVNANKPGAAMIQMVQPCHIWRGPIYLICTSTILYEDFFFCRCFKLPAETVKSVAVNSRTVFRVRRVSRVIRLVIVSITMLQLRAWRYRGRGFCVKQCGKSFPVLLARY